MLLVNGIPLVVIECKSPNLDNPITAAINDLLQYSNQRNSSQPEGAEKLFHYNLLMIAASRGRAVAGAVGANHEYYVEWKTDLTPLTPLSLRVSPAETLRVSEAPPQEARQSPTAGNPPTALDSPQAREGEKIPLPASGEGLGVGFPANGERSNTRQMLIAGMLNPTNLLDILRNFTLYETSGGRTIKIVPRYQQYRAVQEAIDRLLHNQTRLQHGTDDQRGGIIWHTQGAGKSLTMVYLIRKIRTIPELRRFKIVVVTDRTDLEKQLSDTAVLTGEPLQIAKKVKKLEQYLQQPGAGLVFGMIQK
ncbi:type I restriction endonuclease [Scytonema sp. PRP1]|uniref:type I restriction endonuclease n=1 Tax=Scytonema sp. PRP1 TaxID=3120513 RepID=UPI002FD6B51F